jgi:hypothetical protein
MPTAATPRRPARTLLGELIRQRRQTAEEFSADAERFARDHGLRATLSPRHVQRLIAGRHSDGRPLGPLRPATQRLLELMFDTPITQLLNPPEAATPGTANEPRNDAEELRTALSTSAQINSELIQIFQQQLNNIRRIDRQLGATEVLTQLRDQIEHMATRLDYSLTPHIRNALAAVLVDACTLAGWQSMDQGNLTQAWHYYQRAKAFAHHAESEPLNAYATTAQAITLLDLDNSTEALKLITPATTNSNTPPMIQAWLHGAAGEIYAANNDSDNSNRALDSASHIIERHNEDEPPFIILSPAHLERWRGNALTRLKSGQATVVLNKALRTLEPTFVRARAATQLDLAQAVATTGDTSTAMTHLHNAQELTAQCASVRLDRRWRHLVASITRHRNRTSR